MTALIFYDFEVYQKLWTVVFIDPVRRKETVIVNDKKQLTEFYLENKNEIFIGFNSRNYDQWIFKGILAGFYAKEVNDWIIVKGLNGRKFSDLLKHYPINNFDVMTGYNGLKTLEAFMGNDIRETSIPFDYTGDFTPAMIEEVIKYNRHDVLQTIEVFKHRKTEFDSQYDLLNTFKLPKFRIGDTQANLAAVILGARRVELNDEWAIRLPHTLKLNKYRHVAEWFMDKANHNEDCYLEVEIAGVKHIVAWGGLHGAEDGYIYVCKDDEILIMADITQLYPSLMKFYKLLSRAVHEPERFYRILDTSIRLKNEGKKKEREPYKRICNIVYGAMGAKFNPMYDPLHRKLVCIFGQLLMIDLIEKVEGICELIQSNTDGILVKLKRKDLDKFKAIVADWEKRTMLTMTFDEYEKVYQGDVNNYLAVDYKGKIKSKGAYVKSLGPLDNDLPIVNRAITDYLVKGVHPRDTVMASEDLIDFQKVVKVSSKYGYAVIEHEERIWEELIRNIDVPLDILKANYVTLLSGAYERLSDKTFRVFASTRPTDGTLKKVKPKGGKPEKFANTPERCFIFNESLQGVEIPPYLDRSYYVDLAVSRLKEKFGVTVC